MSSPRQSFLFDDGSADRGVRVVAVLDRAKPADKSQAAFKRLVTQIEEQRAVLRQWQDYRTRYNHRVSSELVPLQSELWQARRRMAFLLDDLLGRPSGLRGKRQRARLQQMLIQLIQDMLLEKSDAELEVIHDKYSDLTYAEDQSLSMALSQDMIENLFGIRMGDQHGATNMEELFAKAEQELRDQMEHANHAKHENIHRQAKKPKSRKAEAAQAKREQAAKEVSQSVRDVYRKLASALHPDRETDAAARQRKTEQMQRVNQAYESSDLLGLLNLQLEIEQIDAAHLASLSAQRLAHYNQVLREQLSELKAEIETVIAPFLLVVAHSRNLIPDMVDRALSEEVARVALSVKQIKADLEDFKDPKKLGAALKEFDMGGGMDEFADLSFLMDEFPNLGQPPRRKRRK